VPGSSRPSGSDAGPEGVGLRAGVAVGLAAPADADQVDEGGFVPLLRRCQELAIHAGSVPRCARRGRRPILLARTASPAFSLREEGTPP
jgi:hypothetical protein